MFDDKNVHPLARVHGDRFLHAEFQVLSRATFRSGFLSVLFRQSFEGFDPGSE